MPDASDLPESRPDDIVRSLIGSMIRDIRTRFYRVVRFDRGLYRSLDAS